MFNEALAAEIFYYRLKIVDINLLICYNYKAFKEGIFI